MEFVSAFLGVIAIIGIIVVGGFVVFFLGDLVLSILDPNYSRFGKNKKQDREDERYEKQIDGPKKETKEIEFKSIEEKSIEKNIESPKAPVVIEQGLSDNFFNDEKDNSGIDNLRAEEEQFRANMLKAIEERRAKREANKVEQEVDFEKFFFDDDDIDVFENEEIAGQENIADLINQENVCETNNQENLIEESEGEVAELGTQKEVDENEILRDKYESEIAKLEDERLSIKQLLERLEREKIEDKEEIAKLIEEKTTLCKGLEVSLTENKPKANLSLEEYEERLAMLQERLAENDKDFRRVKKDFIPLRKVHNTLENDEKKLRRREAIVAKQKVVLYGVNNIVDIDQEKAKKLTEDLDLLEGLKLSVKHCEEVMIANKERYPILEKTYSILLKNNDTLKSDIEELEKIITGIKSNKE